MMNRKQVFTGLIAAMAIAHGPALAYPGGTTADSWAGHQSNSGTSISIGVRDCNTRNLYVKMGTSPGVYSMSNDFGGDFQYTFTFSGLVQGRTYYFRTASSTNNVTPTPQWGPERSFVAGGSSSTPINFGVKCPSTFVLLG